MKQLRFAKENMCFMMCAMCGIMCRRMPKMKYGCRDPYVPPLVSGGL